MHVTVVVTGLEEKQALLVGMAKSFQNFKPEMKSIGAELKTYFGNDVFISHGEDFPKPWKDLTAATTKYKNANYPGRDILQREGDLQAGFFYEHDKTSVYVSNNSDHFIYHQLGTGVGGNQGSISLLGGLARAYSDFGGQGRGRNLPQRQMIGITPRVRTIVRDIIGEGVRKRIDAANDPNVKVAYA
jgi:phage gpG-like protein